MKILFWLVYINAAQNGIHDIAPYLKESGLWLIVYDSLYISHNEIWVIKPIKKELTERELNNEMPYSVDEVFEIFENEIGIDLEKILQEHRKVSLRIRRDGKTLP